MYAFTSDIRHAVTRSENLTGSGNFPRFTIAQIVAAHMGSMPGVLRVLASSFILISLVSVNLASLFGVGQAQTITEKIHETHGAWVRYAP